MREANDHVATDCYDTGRSRCREDTLRPCRISGQGRPAFGLTDLQNRPEMRVRERLDCGRSSGVSNLSRSPSPSDTVPAGAAPRPGLTCQTAPSYSRCALEPTGRACAQTARSTRSNCPPPASTCAVTASSGAKLDSRSNSHTAAFSASARLGQRATTSRPPSRIIRSTGRHDRGRLHDEQLQRRRSAAYLPTTDRGAVLSTKWTMAHPLEQRLDVLIIRRSSVQARPAPPR